MAKLFLLLRPAARRGASCYKFFLTAIFFPPRRTQFEPSGRKWISEEESFPLNAGFQQMAVFLKQWRGEEDEEARNLE